MMLSSTSIRHCARRTECGADCRHHPIRPGSWPGFLTDQFATTLHASVIPSAGEHIGRRARVTSRASPYSWRIAADAGGTVTSRIRRSVHGSRFGRAEQIGKLGGHLIDGHFVKIFVPGSRHRCNRRLHHERQTIIGSCVVADGLGVLDCRYRSPLSSSIILPVAVILTGSVGKVPFQSERVR